MQEFFDSRFSTSFKTRSKAPKGINESLVMTKKVKTIIGRYFGRIDKCQPPCIPTRHQFLSILPHYIKVSIRFLEPTAWYPLHLHSDFNYRAVLYDWHDCYVNIGDRQISLTAWALDPI